MSKKITLLALAAVSAVLLALPAMAMAEVPVHVTPKPEGSKTVDGVGVATLTGGFGSVECAANSGKAEFTSTTKGTFEQTFTGCKLAGSSCTTSGQAVAGTITTQSLPFDLVTVQHTPANGTSGAGLLVTPNAATGQFATFTCGFLGFTVKGNGLIGTITSPACGVSSTSATVSFSSSATGVQTHKTLTGTETEYSLENLGSKASEDAHGTITLGTSAKLECT
jgi:hypothetical protein